jgi:hypothetical protein
MVTDHAFEVDFAQHRSEVGVGEEGKIVGRGKHYVAHVPNHVHQAIQRDPVGQLGVLVVAFQDLEVRVPFQPLFVDRIAVWVSQTPPDGTSDQLAQETAHPGGPAFGVTGDYDCFFGC